jgi:hypothetical protein
MRRSVTGIAPQLTAAASDAPERSQIDTAQRQRQQMVITMRDGHKLSWCVPTLSPLRLLINHHHAPFIPRGLLNERAPWQRSSQRKRRVNRYSLSLVWGRSQASLLPLSHQHGHWTCSALAGLLASAPIGVGLRHDCGGTSIFREVSRNPLAFARHSSKVLILDHTLLRLVFLIRNVDQNQPQ